MQLEVNKEYVYMGQFVKLMELSPPDAPPEQQIASIQTRFFEVSECQASELKPQ